MFKYFEIESQLQIHHSDPDRVLGVLRDIHANPTDELRENIDLVKNGTFYDLFVVNGFSRDDFKDALFPTMLNKPGPRSKLGKLLKQRFPNIMVAFDLVKIDFKKTRREGRAWDEPTNLLSKLYFHIESKLFIDCIACKFAKPVFTVHDALLTTPDLIDELVELMMAETEAIYGIRPHVKTSAL